jgi:futalosine hydrolase
MKILIVAATAAEISGIAERLADDLQVTILTTGVGMVATSFSLGEHFALHPPYDLVINAGIAGAFDRSLKLGEVVMVYQDTFSELGAEDDQTFIPIDVMGYGACTLMPKPFEEADFKLKKVNAITVNTVHGNHDSIGKIEKLLRPQLESMEGAAVFYACQQRSLPVVQIRAVSNYVEKRNKLNWEISLAVTNLNDTLWEIIQELRQNT